MTSFYQRGAEKRRNLQEMRLKEQEIGSCGTRPVSPKIMLEQEKRLRREIANSNERRRMQSINAGFQSLKTIIPHNDGEKLSKAAILQQTSEYICRLEQEKSKVLAENTQLKQMLLDLGMNPQTELPSRTSPPPKRKKRDTESSDEGIGLSCADSDDHLIVEEQKREIQELRRQLEMERKHRKMLEERNHGCRSTTIKAENGPIAVETETTTKDQEVLIEKWNQGSEIEAAQHVPRPCSTPSPPTNDVSSTVSPFLAQVSSVNSCLSLSRRNLDTIVEAIRHLEGDTILVDPHSHNNERSVPASCAKTSRIPHSSCEESSSDSSYDQEDIQSDVSSSSGSGCDPLGLSPMECETVEPDVCTTTMTTSSPRAAATVEMIPQAHQLPPLSSSTVQLPVHLSHHHASQYLDGTSSSLALQLLHTSSLPACPPPAGQLPQLLATPSIIVKRS